MQRERRLQAGVSWKAVTSHRTPKGAPRFADFLLLGVDYSSEFAVLEFEHPAHALGEFAVVRHDDERHGFFAVKFDE